MKLIRFGTRGLEKPGIVTAEGRTKDVSAHVQDYDHAFFSSGGLETLRSIAAKPDSLPDAPADELAELPRELVDRLSGEAGRSLKDAELVKMLEQQGVEPQFAGPEELARRMKSDLAMYTGLIRGLGIKPD